MTTTELETIMFIGFAALARCVDPEKLPAALEYVNGIIGNPKAKLSEAERSGLQFLFDVVELRHCPIQIDSAKSPDGEIGGSRMPCAHLKIVDPTGS